jgi:hypothetical protein
MVLPEVSLPSQTNVSKTVINAYNVAHYRVTGQGAFTLLIKRKSAPLAALMKRHQVKSAAFITAYNPHGKKIREALNFRAHKALKREIERLGFVCFEGVGEDPSGQWKVEPSYLVMGISLEEAKVMGQNHGQNAVVWTDSDAVPQIILLR